jgi:hypothetical protein
MILRHKNPYFVLGTGLLFMTLGILGVVLLKRFGGDSLSFTTGFLNGLSYSLLGVSLVLNIVGLYRIRNHPFSKE